MASDDLIELDRIAGTRHPRDAVSLYGHDKEEAAFLDAYRTGRMPHAWLLAGPEGIGKASFAWRAARFVLSHPDPTSDAVQSAQSLDVDPLATVSRTITAQAHPDLFVLRREMEPGKKTIPRDTRVELVRKALSFFSATAGKGGWKIAIVDTLDDLNRSGANALLKLIEEPPARSLFLMVSHMPGRLLPTIRSRCRLLPFRPLSQSDVARILSELPEPPEASLIEAAAARSEGSLTRAMTFVDPDLLAIVRHVEATLSRLPELDRSEILAMAETLAPRDKTLEFETVLQTIEGWILADCHEHLSTGAHRLAPLTEVWEKTARGARDTERFNLDRRPFLLTLFADLAEAVRLSHAQ